MSAKYEINTNHNGRQWVATFNHYDGAPDATGNSSLLGIADDEVDAIVDLLTSADLEDEQ